MIDCSVVRYLYTMYSRTCDILLCIIIHMTTTYAQLCTELGLRRNASVCAYKQSHHCPISNIIKEVE